MFLTPHARFPEFLRQFIKVCLTEVGHSFFSAKSDLRASLCVRMRGMDQWNEGYFTDFAYTYGYFYEVSPLYQKFCLLLNGYASSVTDEHSAYCELGYGQGVSANIHAAATPGTFYGTDFTPSHASHSQELCRVSGCGGKFYEDSFMEFLERTDLPTFESISLHGIWSWVTEENRKAILQIVRRHLNSGGIFYNSYNSLPGWAAFAPLREILYLYDANCHKNSDHRKRVENALNFARELFHADPAYLRIVPKLPELLEEISKSNHDYLAHEYFNPEWHCMYFSEVAKMHADMANLEYACTAEPLDVIKSYQLTQEASQFLQKIDNPLMREEMRDIFFSRQFRKDLYVRGIRCLSAAEKKKRILETRVALVTAAPVTYKVSGIYGEVGLKKENYEPFIEWLKEDAYSPKYIGEYLKKYPDIPYDKIEEMVKILFGRFNLMPCQSEKSTEYVKKRCSKLNEYICKRSLSSKWINFLASPVLGLGVYVNRFEQIFLYHIFHEEKKNAEYKATAEDISINTLSILEEQNEKIVIDGKIFESREENLNEIKRQADEFLKEKYILLKAIGVA